MSEGMRACFLFINFFFIIKFMRELISLHNPPLSLVPNFFSTAASTNLLCMLSSLTNIRLTAERITFKRSPGGKHGGKYIINKYCIIIIGEKNGSRSTRSCCFAAYLLDGNFDGDVAKKPASNRIAVVRNNHRHELSKPLKYTPRKYTRLLRQITLKLG